MTQGRLTTSQAAELVGMEPRGFRRAMNRLRAEGTDFRLPVEVWPDRRSPLWDEDGLRLWHATRRRRPRRERTGG